MSKKESVRNKFFPLASNEEIAAAEEKIRAVGRAARRPRKLKVDPVIETVVRCISEGKSSRRICQIVAHIHEYQIKKDSILRFKKSLPGSTTN